ncbi:MAG TPA: SCO5389 family protein [Streptosporangiaceae bacterium]
MSLTVAPDLLDQARAGDIDQSAFLDTIRTSLPYAYELIASLTASLPGSGDEFADNQVPPATEAERGQLLRALASDAIRGGLEQHFGVTLAFQNCHRVAVFRAPAGIDVTGTRRYQEFISPRSQVLNQSPQLRNC